MGRLSANAYALVCIMVCLFSGSGQSSADNSVEVKGLDTASVQKFSFSPEIIAAQKQTPAPVPSLDDAIKQALAAAQKAAKPLINTTFHSDGRRLLVPDQFSTIQHALDEANAGDSVVVSPGTYYERLFIRDGIRLISFAKEAGEQLVPVKDAYLTLPRRALQTIIDGSKDKLSPVGMLTFAKGASRNTIVNGFTIQNLPEENHHIPSHSHTVNIRGASPVVMNCYIRDNGSTGIGSHVVYFDQSKPVAERDFRKNNIEYQTSAVVYRNIIRNNLGRGIGSNHFSKLIALGNEVFENDDSSLGEKPGPGIGIKHGAEPVIIGNIVHDNPYGGIKAKVGILQGVFHVDQAPSPRIDNNVVFRNGNKQNNLSCFGAGSKEKPIIISNNVIFESGNNGISISANSFAEVTGNTVTNSKSAGIAINGSTVTKLNENIVTKSRVDGFRINQASSILEMKDNHVFDNSGKDFQ